MQVLDLFSGIGGFTLGLERAGFTTIAFCEIEPYARKVLAKHWPDVPIYEDVRNVTKERLNADGIFPRVITGGFPCQDISVAGKQAGISEGTRSGLWSECARILGEFRPDIKYAVFENVSALLSGNNGEWFQQVLWDISQVGYDAEWHCIPASELGAHHHRDRVWIICYPQHNGQSAAEIRESNQAGNGSDEEGQKSTGESAGSGNSDNVADTISKRGRSRNAEWKNAGNAGQPPILERKHTRGVGAWDVEPELGRVANGIPQRSHRLKGLGNAVVPQIPELIGRAILAAGYE